MSARPYRRENRQPRDRSRVRAKARAARRLPPAGVDELNTAHFLELVAELLPDAPACPGPMLVHADGSFECHGRGCPGGIAARHLPAVVHPCQDQPHIAPYVACERCATAR